METAFLLAQSQNSPKICILQTNLGLKLFIEAKEIWWERKTIIIKHDDWEEVRHTTVAETCVDWLELIPTKYL